MPPVVLSPAECVNAVEPGENNGLASPRGDVELPLYPQDTAVSPRPGMPHSAASTLRERIQRHRAKLCAIRKRWLLAVFVILVVAVILVSIHIPQSASTYQHCPATEAPVLGCPYEWVGHRNVCFYLSELHEEGDWDQSQQRCSEHRASLAVIGRNWEMEFLRRLKGNLDYWLGLRRRGERLVWADGTSFEETFQVQGMGECVYLNDDDVASSSCSQSRPFICSKSMAPVAPPKREGGERTVPVLGTHSSSG